MKTFRQKFGDKTLTCQKMPATKQLRLMHLLAEMKEADEKEEESSRLELLKLFKVEDFEYLAEHTNLMCDSVQLGDVVVEAKVLDHVDDICTDIGEFLEIYAWMLECTFSKK